MYTCVCAVQPVSGNGDVAVGVTSSVSDDNHGTKCSINVCVVRHSELNGLLFIVSQGVGGGWGYEQQTALSY